MSEERRASPRRNASIAGEIETAEGKASIAITRDVSAQGLLLLSRMEHAIGDALKMKLVVGQTTFEIAVKVARQDVMSPHESSLWRTKVGVVVDDQAQLATIIEALDRPGTERGH